MKVKKREIFTLYQYTVIHLHSLPLKHLATYRKNHNSSLPAHLGKQVIIRVVLATKLLGSASFLYIKYKSRAKPMRTSS